MKGLSSQGLEALPGDLLVVKRANEQDRVLSRGMLAFIHRVPSLENVYGNFRQCAGRSIGRGVRISPLLLHGFASLLSESVTAALLMDCRLANETWALGSPQPLDWRLDQGPGLGV